MCQNEKTQKIKIELERDKGKISGAHVICPLMVEINKMKKDNLIPRGFGFYEPHESLMECKGCRKHRGFNSNMVFINCVYQSGDAKLDIDKELEEEKAQREKSMYSSVMP
jgi:hypothetical protein